MWFVSLATHRGYLQSLGSGCVGVCVCKGMHVCSVCMYATVSKGMWKSELMPAVLNCPLLYLLRKAEPRALSFAGHRILRIVMFPFPAGLQMSVTIAFVVVIVFRKGLSM